MEEKKKEKPFFVHAEEWIRVLSPIFVLDRPNGFDIENATATAVAAYRRHEWWDTVNSSQNSNQMSINSDKDHHIIQKRAHQYRSIRFDWTFFLLTVLFVLQDAGIQQHLINQRWRWYNCRMERTKWVNDIFVIAKPFSSLSHKHITFHLAMMLDPYRCWNRRIYALERTQRSRFLLLFFYKTRLFIGDNNNASIAL